jgi:hypothetical protein
LTNKGLSLTQDKSWLDGTPGGISAPKFEKFRGVATATSVLPLMVGPKQLVARQFKSKQIAQAHILNVPMIIVIAVVFLAGLFGTFFVPTLPGDHNRRRFDIFSFLVELKGGHLRLSDDDTRIQQPISGNVTLEEAKTIFGKRKVAHSNNIV